MKAIWVLIFWCFLLVANIGIGQSLNDSYLVFSPIVKSLKADKFLFYEISEIGEVFLKEFPPDKFFYVGVGRSPVGVLAYLEARSKNSTQSLPLSQFRYFSLDQNLKNQLFDYFDRWLDFEKMNGRTPLFIDYVSGRIVKRGLRRTNSLLSLARFIRTYSRKRNIENVKNSEFAGIGDFTARERFLSLSEAIKMPIHFVGVNQTAVGDLVRLNSKTAISTMNYSEMQVFAPFEAFDFRIQTFPRSAGASYSNLVAKMRSRISLGEDAYYMSFNPIRGTAKKNLVKQKIGQCVEMLMGHSISLD